MYKNGVCTLSESFASLQQVGGLFDMVSNMQYLFLVGGFSESQLLQERVKRAFSDRIKVVIPQVGSVLEVGLNRY